MKKIVIEKINTIDKTKIKEKHKKIYTSIKWKIFLYLIGFSALLLVVLWLFQIVLLPSFYNEIKVKDIEKSSKNIAKILENATGNMHMGQLILDEKSYQDIYLITSKSNLYVDVWMLSEVGVESIMKINVYSLGIQENMDSEARMDVYEKALKNGGQAGFSYSGISLNAEYSMAKVDVLLYADVCNIQPANIEFLLTVSSNISLLDSTTMTLQSQLQYITIIMIVLSIGIALIIARYVSSPIEQINESAKELGRGNYNTNFDGRGYKEVSELSDTLNNAAKELGKVETLQRELIANVSHDLRTPLTMISGYSEMIRDIPKEATSENMQIIVEESQRLTSLVNDLLDISRTQSISKVNFENFNITKTIKRVLQRFKKFTQKDGYKINFNFDQEVNVYGDESRILQVIYNFLTNALTHTGQDKVINVNQIVTKDIVRIEVCDTGKGIKEEEIPQVWNKYYQIGENHKRAVTGTGLGLTIVKDNLMLHENIKFGVDSKINQGSNFWFEMPIVQIKRINKLRY